MSLSHMCTYKDSHENGDSVDVLSQALREFYNANGDKRVNETDISTLIKSDEAQSDESTESDCETSKKRCADSGSSESDECGKHRRNCCQHSSESHSSSKECGCKTHKRAKKPCKRCKLFSRSIVHLVQRLCRVTCRTCEHSWTREDVHLSATHIAQFFFAIEKK